MSPLVSKSRLRRLLLDLSNSERQGKFTRVAPEMYDRAESLVRQWAASQVKQQPSSGKTINPS